MKKCPYCAEEIQEEAIVCRYCGRDLQTPVQPVKPELPKPVQKSIWKASRPVAIVFTILYVIGTFINFINFPSTSELAGRLTFGLLATFFGWWAIFALVVWLWRKLGALKLFLLAGGVVLAIIAIAWNSNQVSVSPTPTRVPPTRQTEPEQLFFDDLVEEAPTPRPASNCTWWYNVTNNDVGKSGCVQGVVDSITGNTETSSMARIYFQDPPALFYFLDDTYYYSALEVGHCISSTGVISVDEDGVFFMRINGNLTPCP